ncbi:MAG: ACT domain-containing protein [Proteobacteria bacterium]|nr:ACT domain-containing protein [Pseudomonadota bacterium]
MAHQISVFVENKPGRLERVTEILAKAKVNIRPSRFPEPTNTA